MTRKTSQTTTAKKIRTESRRLRDLKPHPRQGLDFGDLPEDDFQALVKDIQTRGLKHKIVILRNNVIISGHQRRRALLSLGIDRYDVIVRYDLDPDDEDAVEREYLAENCTRRQLTPLRKAKLALRMMEIDQKQERGALLRCSNATARERVGKALGMSGRNLARYLAILQAPPELQKAFDEGSITLQQVARCLAISKELQAELVLRLRAAKNTEDVKRIITAVVAKARSRAVTPQAAMAAFTRILTRAQRDLAPYLSRLTPDVISQHRQELRAGNAMIRKMLERLSAGQ